MERRGTTSDISHESHERLKVDVIARVRSVFDKRWAAISTFEQGHRIFVVYNEVQGI